MGDGEKDPEAPPQGPPPLPSRPSILIGDPIHVGGARPWVCIGKVRIRLRGTTDELAVGHYFKRIMVANRLLGDRDAHVDAFTRADAVRLGKV